MSSTTRKWAVGLDYGIVGSRPVEIMSKLIRNVRTKSTAARKQTTTYRAAITQMQIISLVNLVVNRRIVEKSFLINRT